MRARIGVANAEPTPKSSAVYRDQYQRTRARLGRQPGPKIARVDIARRLAEALAHAHQRERVRSGRRRLSSGYMMAPSELRHRTILPSHTLRLIES